MTLPHSAFASKPSLVGRLKGEAEPGPAAAPTSRNMAYVLHAQQIYPESSHAILIYSPGVGPALQHEQSSISSAHTLSLALSFVRVSC